MIKKLWIACMAIAFVSTVNAQDVKLGVKLGEEKRETKKKCMWRSLDEG